MADILAASPLLTIFIALALGALVGAIPFGPLKLGAAGALFVGLAIGAAVPGVGDSLGLVQSLGLALFVYMVGLSAGQTFFSDLRRQAPLMGWSVLVLAVAGVGAVIVGKIAGVSAPIVAGVYAGSLTSTPALAAANSAAPGGEPSVGYAIGYPVGVIIAIIIVAIVVGQTWPAKNDGDTLSGKDITATSVKVVRPRAVRDVAGYAEQILRMSYLRREGRTRVISPGEELREGDEVLLVGTEDIVNEAAEQLGDTLATHLADDRADVDFRHVLVSNPDLAGKTVAELNLAARFGGVITRVRRGDLELLARDDLVLELGDRALVVVPAGDLDKATRFFGDSERGVSSFSALSVGVGMALGLLLGMVEISLPGGSAFSLGAAAGPLIVGMIVGYLHRTGPIIWQIPQAANLTIRQLGLLIFLAAVGVTAGPDFATFALTAQGAWAGAVGVITVVLTTALAWLGGRVLGLSAERTSGAIAGLIGQPAILSYAMSRKPDEKIGSGYAALFALGIVVKILLIHAILAV